MSAIALKTAPPLGAVFSQQPEMALPTTRLTQIVRPINGTQSLTITGNNSSTVEFNLTSQNLLDPYGCYLMFDIKIDAPVKTSGGVYDIFFDFLGAASVISNLTILGPDGNELERIDNYNLLAHAMIKANVNEDFIRSAGNVMMGVSSATGASGTYNTTAPTASETDAASTLKTYAVPLFLAGLFSSNTEKYFPLNKIRNGITLKITFEKPRNCYHASAVTPNAALGTPTSPPQYYLSNLGFVMDTVRFEDPEYDNLLNQKISSEGLTYFTDTYLSQPFQITAGGSQFSAITSKIYSSLKDIYFFQQLGTTTTTATTNPTNMDLNTLSSFNIMIGSKQLPGAPIKVGGHSYAELRKSFNKLNDFNAGGLITGASYVTTDAIFGVNFQNHLGISRNGLEMISGTNTNDPSSPQNLQLDLYSSGSFAQAVLYTYLHYDLAYHITPDGRVTTTYSFMRG